MKPNLKLMTNVSFDNAPVSEVSILSWMITPSSHYDTSTKQPSYLLMVLVVLVHISAAIWLKNSSDTLPIVKDVLPPMMVNLVSEPSPEPEIDPLQQTPTKPTVKQQVAKKPIVKQLPTPLPVANEPVAEPIESLVQTPPTFPAPQVTVKPKELVEHAPAKAEPEPVIEPPKFGAAYLHNPAPDYPSMSRRAGEQGRVLLKVIVSTKGEAEDVQLETSSGFNRLDDAAIEAVKKWQFVPAKRNNQPLSASVLVPVKFSLESK
ncbi:MAG: energy transducer TonB [Methylotenera sp.]|nr:energy transducer TonB [Methylotenera sp.]